MTPAIVTEINRFRKPPQLGFNFDELLIDNFAGGGGASTGLENAMGRPVDIAVNHDEIALALHDVNHPGTRHYRESVWDIDPVEVCGGRPVGLGWFSPDCRHFSRAKGDVPVKKNIRGLAWVALKWAGKKRPRVIFLENVEELKTWGPLVAKRDKVTGRVLKVANPDADEKDRLIEVAALGERVPVSHQLMVPDPKKKGRTFRDFVNSLRKLGYEVEYKELRACDYGVPTIRKRLFLIARCDGQPIRWPEPTHGDPKSLGVQSGKLLPWKTAADCIDFSIPCQSIFDRKKPLAEATMRRIAKGIMRYVVNTDTPFIVPTTQPGAKGKKKGCLELVHSNTEPHKNNSHLVASFLAKHYGGVVGSTVTTPIGTITSVDHHSLVTATLIRHFGQSVGSSMGEPVGAITAGGGGKTGLVTANLVRLYGKSDTATITEPVGAITGKGKEVVVTSHLVKLRGTCADGQRVDEPAPTITAGGSHIGEVRAFLIKYYGADQDPRLDEPLHTITTKARFGLVMIRGELYEIQDIAMRMLTPRELFRCQGFPEDYVIDRDSKGNKITATQQIAKCGNSVPPPMSEALAKANMFEAPECKVANA